MTKSLITASAMILIFAASAHAHAQGNGQRGENFITSWDMSQSGYVSLMDMQTRRSDLFNMCHIPEDSMAAS